jgi:hypothetical protein
MAFPEERSYTVASAQPPVSHFSETTSARASPPATCLAAWSSRKAAFPTTLRHSVPDGAAAEDVRGGQLEEDLL